MKNVILASVLALASVGVANADHSENHHREAAVTAGAQFSDRDGAILGVSYTEHYMTKYGSWYGSLGYDRLPKSSNSVDRLSVVVARDTGFAVQGLPLLLKVGGAYVNPDGGVSGYAWLVGAGTRYTLRDNLTLTVDYKYQVGENDVRGWDGNQVTLGVAAKF